MPRVVVSKPANIDFTHDRTRKKRDPPQSLTRDRRLHGQTGHVPPVDYEINYSLTTTKPQATTTIRDIYPNRCGSDRPVSGAWCCPGKGERPRARGLFPEPSSPRLATSGRPRARGAVPDDIDFMVHRD
ncbi:hypothetical protein GCM10009635_09650 [Actinocatenispora thailandica]